MPTQTTRAWLRRSLAILFVLGSVGEILPALAAEPQKRVLVLYSTRRDSQLVSVGDRELPRIFERGLSRSVDYYSESIDQARFYETDYAEAFRTFVKLKYTGLAFDLVVAMGDIPLEFVASHREELFRNTPVVFFTTRTSSARPANSTGVVAGLSLAGTVALASQLQPDVRNVFVISGATPANKIYTDTALVQFRPFESRLKFTYLSGVSREALESRLTTLPVRSIVYYLVFDQDAAGENYQPLEYLERIAALSNAPVYSWVDSTMDHGVVGGSMKSQTAQMQAVGALALRVLKGEPAGTIPVSAPNLNVREVDWRQLRRWGISEARVPADTVIRFREPTIWDRYRSYIVGAAALLLAESALIAGLLIQRARRRQAERRLRRSQDALQVSYERIRDLGGRLLGAQDAERSRIARELHDDLGQQVALLSIDLEQISGVVPYRQIDRDKVARQAVARVRDLARSMRALSHRLHPAKLRLIGLVPALSSLQRELSRPDLTITFSHRDVPGTVPDDVMLCVFRVVQEALQNAIKHSGAQNVMVDLRGGPAGLQVTVADDGAGFDVDQEWGTGLGLVSMHERLDPLGGVLTVRSKPGAGTRLEISVPLVGAANPDITVSSQAAG
jgi:signal transduction histidine kinase